MVCRGEKTMKVKRINLYSYAKEVLVSGREIFLVATSNLGARRMSRRGRNISCTNGGMIRRCLCSILGH